MNEGNSRDDFQGSSDVPSIRVKQPLELQQYQSEQQKIKPRNSIEGGSLERNPMQNALQKIKSMRADLTKNRRASVKQDLGTNWQINHQGKKSNQTSRKGSYQRDTITNVQEQRRRSAQLAQPISFKGQSQVTSTKKISGKNPTKSPENPSHSPDYETDGSNKEKNAQPPRIPLEQVKSVNRKSFLDKSPQHLNVSRSPFMGGDQDPPLQPTATVFTKVKCPTLKYCQAIFLFFEGDLKTKFHIHSLAPMETKVEISRKPEPAHENDVSINALDQFPDWQCAPALKTHGDIFRILPASDHNYMQKIKGIIKSKKMFEPKNYFKYGEYLESLNEEIKFNLDLYQNHQTQHLRFGTNVIIMHEASRQFLKISSPNLCESNFQFRLKLSSHISEKTIFKLMPSNKLQQESDGKIHEHDQIFLAYAYDKLLQKDLYLYSDQFKLQRGAAKNSSGRCQQVYEQLFFTEDKKLPLQLGICHSLDYDKSDNIYKYLHGKIIQIRHVESELYLSMTIKRKENRVMEMFFGGGSRYILNNMVDHLPNLYGERAVANIHFETKESINTFWRVVAPPKSRDTIILENAVSKIRLTSMHLQMIQRGNHNNNQMYPQFDGQSFYKIYMDSDSGQSPRRGPMSPSRRLENLDSEQNRKYLWVEYLKFNKTENKYEFSKFGKLNEEDKANFFDSFKILPIDIYKQHALNFVGNTFVALREFDFYQADHHESAEYEHLLKVLKDLKKFSKNKLADLINVEEQYGKPNKANQDLLRESFILEELMEITDNLWPDEVQLMKDYEVEDNYLKEGHKELRVQIAELIFEIFLISSLDNLPNQEYVFFEFVPKLQKFFGVGFRKDQDFELFKYLVMSCDQFADYKEKSKYNIIFQFIKKLFKEKRSDVKANIFVILRSFCINSKGVPNHYHQKLLHDLFFFNKMENLRFTLKHGKTKLFKDNKSKSMPTNLKENEEEKKDLKVQKYFQRAQTYTLKDIQEEFKEQETSRMQTLEKIKLNFQPIEEESQNSNRDGYERSSSSSSDDIKTSLSTNRKTEKYTNLHNQPQQISDNTIPIPTETVVIENKAVYEDIEDERENDDFAIKRLHEITFEKLSEQTLLDLIEDDMQLTKIQLYFFADLCYLMNFDCACSHFSHKTVSNLINLITCADKINFEIRAGLVAILNTILRNYSESITKKPNYLRMYEKQRFETPSGQDIIKEKDVKTLITFICEHFRVIAMTKVETFTQFDSEVMRIMTYLIESDLVFLSGFTEGMSSIKDIFEYIGRIQALQVQASKEQKLALKKQISSTNIVNKEDESNLNLEDFDKQFKRTKKILLMNLPITTQGMLENPFAWKSLNLQKQYVSFVEKVIKSRQNRKISYLSKKENEEQENAKLEIVKFYFWLTQLRIDKLLSNVINMFYMKLEKVISKNQVTLDQLIANPDLLSTEFLISKKEKEIKIGVFDDILSYEGDEEDENIMSIEEMFNLFINGLKPQESEKKPLKPQQLMSSRNDLLDVDIFEDSNLIRRNATYSHDFESSLRNLQQQKKMHEIESNLSRQVSLKDQQQDCIIDIVDVNPVVGNSPTGEPNSPGLGKRKQPRIQFLDILIDMFVYGEDKYLQQEVIRVLFKFMNIRRELLHHFQKTIVIFRSSIAQKIDDINKILRKSKILIQDSTIWELPQELNNESAPAQSPPSIHTLESQIESPDFQQLLLMKRVSSVYHLKKEYIKKVKEHQKNQNQMFQLMAFTKSNKPVYMRLQHLNLFIDHLDDISNFFAQNYQRSSPQMSRESQSYEFSLQDVRLSETNYLKNSLSQIQSDLQYAFLAIEGHELIIQFMKHNKELRQECIRTIFFSQKNNPSTANHNDSVQFDGKSDRVIYAQKFLLAYKKCFEILIKFIYNNHTTKQQVLILANGLMCRVVLDHIDDLLLFNSEYYMQSKMVEEVNLFDFDLLNYIIENNAKIKNLNTTLLPKITNLVLYLQKIVEFPKKPLMYASKILHVYSNIIANSGNSKVNDLVVDIILREESFFKIQSVLLGKNNRADFQPQAEHFTIIEKFLKGISTSLRTHNQRMVKKKFYSVFNKMDNLELYFEHLKVLLNLNIKGIQANALKSEEERIEFCKRFLLIESYYIHVFYQLFFDIKATQKQLGMKVKEMDDFIDNRDLDSQVIEPYIGELDIEDWPQYGEYSDAIEHCRNFLTKNLQKTQVNRQSSRNFFKQSTAPSKQLSLQKRDKDKSIFHDSNSSHNESVIKFKVQPSGSTRTKVTKVLSIITQNQIARKKEKVFLSFKWNFLHDDKLKQDLKAEMNYFASELLSKFKLADINSGDRDAQKYHLFFSKLIEYSQLHNEKQDVNDLKLMYGILSNFIDLTNQQQSYKGETFEEKTQIQEKLNQIGAVNMVLEMMCRDTSSEVIDEIFPQLLYFSNRILEGAQNNVQDIFTAYLTKNENSINLFERCFILIQKEIQLLQKINSDNADGQPIKRSATMKDQTQMHLEKKKKVDHGLGSQKQIKVFNKDFNVQKQILKFFKNLCENHNTKMQLLLGNQQNPIKNFDMVSLTVNYLAALISNIKMSKRIYSNAQYCCVALAEYVQGPCQVNQNLIKDANFYQIAVQILQLKPNLIQDIKTPKTNVPSQSASISGLQSQVTYSRFAFKHANQQGTKVFNLFENEDMLKPNTTGFQLTNFMIQKLKLNCTIILFSLLEQRASDDPLLLSMKRSIPIELIKQNILYEYFLFCKDYNKFLSKENFFRHVLTQADDEVQEELIIEVGFNLFFLLKRWSENKRTNDSQLGSVIALINQNKEKYNTKITTLRLLKQFLRYLYTSIKHLVKKCKKRNRSIDEKHKRSRVEKFVSKPERLIQALMFFENHSGSIDVLINGSLEQVYFPHMPYCTYLTDTEKRDFYISLPTDRDKEKIDALITFSTDLIRRMKIEYNFKKFFSNYPFIGAFVYYTELWQTISFYAIIILNFMNLYSYTGKEGYDRLKSPTLFKNVSVENTETLFNLFGIIQIIMALCINITVISKRIIYHYEVTWHNKKGEELESFAKRQQEQEKPFWKRKSFWKKSLNYCASASQDFMLVYYCGYLIFSFFGYFFHPFFYAYHMIDIIIRNSYLKNVLKAIYRPRYELLYTLILFICLQYIFAIFAYLFFPEDFQGNECTSLSQCFLVIIDQTFKNDGGPANFLRRSYPDNMADGSHIHYGRMIFDNLFNLILVILVVEIISGIIIDTFGALREEHNKITESIENKCMICGKNRDQIEKEYQDALEKDSDVKVLNNDKAFEIHKNDRHNIYDYIFFLGYLTEKPELEYTGLESFVFEKYSENNNTWFPIYKVGGDKQSHQLFANDEQDSYEDGSDNSDSDDGNGGNGEGDNVGSKLLMGHIMSLHDKLDIISDRLGLGMMNGEGQFGGDDYEEEEEEQDLRGSSMQRVLQRLQTSNTTMTFGFNNKAADPPSRQQTSQIIQRGNSGLLMKAKKQMSIVNAFRK